jgi:hypothetical protein
MKYKEILILTVALMLLAVLTVGPAAAKSENISMGPYHVSFNLTTTEPYMVTLNSTSLEVSSTGMQSVRYRVELTTPPYTWDSDMLMIDIERFQNPIRQDYKSLLPGYADYRITNKTIDGHKGFLVYSSGAGGDSVRIIYYLDSNTEVFLLSTFPIFDVTIDLVRTLHVTDKKV